MSRTALILLAAIAILAAVSITGCTRANGAATESGPLWTRTPAEQKVVNDNLKAEHKALDAKVETLKAGKHVVLDGTSQASVRIPCQVSLIRVDSAKLAAYELRVMKGKNLVAVHQHGNYLILAAPAKNIEVRSVKDLDPKLAPQGIVGKVEVWTS